MIRYEYANARTDRHPSHRIRDEGIVDRDHAADGEDDAETNRYPEVAFVEPVHLRREVPGGLRRRLDLRDDEEHREEEVVEDNERPPRQPQLTLGVVPQCQAIR